MEKNRELDFFGSFQIQKDDMEKALYDFFINWKETVIKEKDFFIFSNNLKNKKYLAFISRDENFEDIKNRIFEIFRWDSFLIFSSGSVSLSLKEDRNYGGAQFVLNIGKDKDENQIAFEHLKIFQPYVKKFEKITKQLTRCDFIVKACFYNLEKQTPKLVEN